MRVNKRRVCKLENEGEMSLSVTTEDRFNPDVVCLNGTVWLQYHGSSDCEKVVDRVRSMTRKSICEWLSGSKCFSDRMIFDFSLFANNMANGVKKKLSVEVVLKRKSGETFEKMASSANAGLRWVFRQMLSEFEKSGFTLSSGKKK